MKLSFNTIRPSRFSTAGFSIIELIVALSIFVILSTIMLLNYNSLNRRLTLDTLAHEMAQWVRQTQVSALSVKRTQVLSTIPFPGYGLYFDIANPDQFIFFADKLAIRNSYEVGTGQCGTALTECEQVIKLPKGTTIEKICGETTAPGAGVVCGALTQTNTASIIFTRPDPDAYISDNTDPALTPPIFSRIQITLLSGADYRRMIEVWTTGQISVK